MNYNKIKGKQSLQKVLSIKWVNITLTVNVKLNAYKGEYYHVTSYIWMKKGLKCSKGKTDKEPFAEKALIWHPWPPQNSHR